MRKKYFLFFIFLQTNLFLIAQQESWHKKRISSSLIENFVSSSTNKKNKNGEYFVINNNNKELVRGKFKNGEKDSIWTFFSESGDIIQQFDYRKNKILYNTLDDHTIVKETFKINSPFDDTLKVIPPIKIGGINYGFYLLYDEKAMPIEVKQQKNNILMEYVFTISELGKLEDWHIVYSSTFYNDELTMPINNLPTDAYEFKPALVGNKAIKSKLIYQIPLNINQARDKGTYNIPTPKN